MRKFVAKNIIFAWYLNNHRDVCHESNGPRAIAYTSSEKNENHPKRSTIFLN